MPRSSPVFCTIKNSSRSLSSTPFRGLNPKSGRRESNPAYMHPMHVYCRYTTARLLLFIPRNRILFKLGQKFFVPEQTGDDFGITLGARKRVMRLGFLWNP